MFNVGKNRGNWRNSEVVRRPSNGRIVKGVTTRIAVKEISGSSAGIGFKTMIKDLTIEDTNLQIEVKMTILVEGTKEKRGSSENFSRGGRRQRGRLNVLKVSDV
ncbi:hypothetical protein TNCV_1196691 [Trichonephila clavipes]|uniref:Uncharacterized protein n=1 Tax=Trichonephila clavipes TaxID=2585209 RepID=A0A8X6V932_TRICX|nr:hypothetical protein TNCV_1196691 [Trichonephila clavipes]